MTDNPNPPPAAIGPPALVPSAPQASPNPTAAAANPAPAAALSAPVAPVADRISIDDFMKVELRTAKVLTAEKVEKSKKLLKLTVDVGTEHRTLVAGIAEAYAPDQLVGKSVIVVANLEPATIRGVASQGMILAAGDAQILGLSALDHDVPPGTRVR